MMATKRVIRGGIQLGSLVAVVFIVLLLLDNRYEVLPDSIHNHLPLHHPGFVLTDVTVKTCSSLNPLDTCRLDPKQWDRIEKDLYLRKSWTASAYVHVKRKKEEDISRDDKVLLDLQVSRQDPGKRDDGSGLWERRAAGIWIQRSPHRREVDSKQAITAVDVLFGPDAVDPRDGWTLRDTPLRIGGLVPGLEPRVTLRSGIPKAVERPVLKIRPNGKFKILQVSDLHLATGLGVCRDPYPAGQGCDADTRTLEFVAKVLDSEEPDLVVLSGDQVNGDTAPDAQSAIFKFADLMIRRKIPYAAIFGNHDDEGTMSRSASMLILEALPYSLSQRGPSTVAGVGNYVLEVQAASAQHSSALSLYLLDTHSYSPDETHFHGYNWIKDDQIAWFRDTSHKLRQQHHKYAKIHLDMAFIHIPLPEYRHTQNHRVGEWREAVTAPKYNSHFKDALVEQGVMLVSAGHDHANDYCSLERADAAHSPSRDTGAKPQLWMCYAGGSGFGGYGGYGHYVRRVRAFEVDANGATISTWKRVEAGDTAARVDFQVVVSEGVISGGSENGE